MNSRIASALAITLALISITLLSANCGNSKTTKAKLGQPIAESEPEVPFTLPEELVGSWVSFKASDNDLATAIGHSKMELLADGVGRDEDNVHFTWKVVDSHLVLSPEYDDDDEDRNMTPSLLTYAVEGVRLTVVDADDDTTVFVKKEYGDAVRKGLAFMCADKYDSAVVEFSTAVRLDPEFANGYQYRGVAYYWQKNNDRAIADFSEIVRLRPNAAKGYSLRGSLYNAKKECDSAIAEFTKVIELDSDDNPSAYNNRGWAYCLKGEYDRGLEDIEKALELDDKKHYIYHSRGYAYSGKMEYDKAIADFTESLRLKKTDEAFTDRGKAYIEIGDYAAAIEDFESALSINPEYPGAAEGLDKAKRLLTEKEKGDGKKGNGATKKTK